MWNFTFVKPLWNATNFTSATEITFSIYIAQHMCNTGAKRRQDVSLSSVCLSVTRHVLCLNGQNSTKPLHYVIDQSFCNCFPVTNAIAKILIASNPIHMWHSFHYSEVQGSTCTGRLFTCEVNCQGVWPNKIITDERFTSWVDHRWTVNRLMFRTPVSPIQDSVQRIINSLCQSCKQGALFLQQFSQRSLLTVSMSMLCMVQYRRHVVVFMFGCWEGVDVGGRWQWQAGSHLVDRVALSHSRL